VAGAGGERVITALLSIPRLGVLGYLAALPALLKERRINDKWRAYVGECLRTVTENTAKYFGGTYMTTKWADIVDPNTKDTRNGAKIAADVIERAGLTLVISSEMGWRHESV
jgi:hypothetical protein